jgi:hypothetical protein
VYSTKSPRAGNAPGESSLSGETIMTDRRH